MKHSTRSDRNLRKFRRTRPSIAAARRAIADEVIRESIHLYEQAKHACLRFEEAAAGDRALDVVEQVLTSRLVEAETHLIRAILAPIDAFGPCDPEKHLHPSRGVRCDGKVYLVTPDQPDANVFSAMPTSDKYGAADAAVMHLHVVDESRVADVGTIADRPAYEPYGAALEHVDDPGDLGTAC
jgi:hypothetical protein